MQTAIFIYAVMWILFVVPLLGFNFKRLYERAPNGRRKIKWPQTISFSVIFVLITVFLAVSLNTTLVSRYEIASERYARVYADYLAGKIDQDEYVVESKKLSTSDADQYFVQWVDEMDLSLSGKVRFQISDWIIPKYYQEGDVFPDTLVIDDNNPVFVILLFDNGTDQKYFLIRMVSDEDGANWKVNYAEPATEEQLKQANYALPNQKTGKWFNVV